MDCHLVELLQLAAREQTQIQAAADRDLKDLEGHQMVQSPITAKNKTTIMFQRYELIVATYSVGLCYR